MWKVVPHGELSPKHSWQLIVVVLCQLYHYLWVVSYICCLFSYHSLLELHNGGQMHQSQTAREWAIEVGLLFRQAEWRLDAELLLDEYPRWEIEAPHRSVILHEMFLHTTKWGQKEAERFICQGHWGSLPRPDPEVDQSAMKLVGYQTSHNDIRDLYYSVYLLRSPDPPPCRPQHKMEAIHDILSSLRNHLHWWVYPVTAKKTHKGLSMNLSLDLGEGRPAWGSPLGSQGSLPEGARGCPDARKWHWETKPGVERCPMSLPP